MTRKLVGKGSVEIVDLTDDRQIIAYVGSTLQRQVIYDPNSDTYNPDYGITPIELFAELYVAGDTRNRIEDAKSIKWYKKINGAGELIEVQNDGTYALSGDSLIITENVLEENMSMLYQVEITYPVEQADGSTEDLIVLTDIELVRLSSGRRGQDGKDGEDGKDGIPGEPGDDGRTSYAHISYATSDIGDDFSHNTFDGATHIGMYVDFEKRSSDNPEDYEWTLIKGRDGSDGVPGKPGDDGRTPYFHAAWANSEDGTEGFSTSDSEDKIYIGTYTDFTQADSTDPSKYNWVKVKGESGPQGIPGNDGNDGRSSYTHIAYSTGTEGQSFSHESFPQATHIGMYESSNQNSSSNWRDYEWTLTKGRDGTDGIPGKQGEDGRTPYFHVAYSNSSDGKDEFSTSDSENKEFIGQYTDYTQADSTNPDDYTWTKIKGDKGEDGTDGVDGEDSILTVLTTPNGNTIRNHEGTLTVELTLYKGADTVIPSTIRWYKLNPSADGDSYSGPGWSKLSETGSTLTITGDQINGTGVFMAIPTYIGKEYRNQVTLLDIVDEYTVNIIGPTTFKNGDGEVKLTAKVYQTGEEVDEHGGDFTYSWSNYDTQGNLNTSFEKYGKTIVVTADEVENISEVQCFVQGR